MESLDRAWRTYSRIAAGLFVLITLYSVPVKLFDGRLGEDWLHSALHIASALAGGYAGWYATSAAPARAFTWGVAAVYSALGVYGWFTPGFFTGTPFAIPLGPADNLFHLLLGLPAAAPAFADLTRTARPVRPAG